MRAKRGRNNWEHQDDELDGIPFVDGEKVKVTFPDGTEYPDTLVTCTKTKVGYSDHGHPGSGIHTRAYVRIILHGVGVKIRLVDQAVDVEREA